MKVVGIIQARLGSTRLPGKMLMSLGDSNLLEYVYLRASAIRNISQVVVATTDSVRDDRLVSWCKKRGFEIFRGDEQDLLKRFLACARHYNAEYIVRITGDCPFFSIEMAETLIDIAINTKCQYAYMDSTNIPIGLKVSVIETKTLEKIESVATHPYYREHITLYMDEHLKEFRVMGVKPPEQYLQKSYRLTVDMDEDLQLCRKIVERLASNVLISSDEVINILDKDPKLAEINAKIEQKKFIVNKKV